MMYAAAEATWATVPAKATAKTTHDAETRETLTRISAARKPLRSATATPMITTTMVAIGGNDAKLSTIVETAMASPSPLSRFRTMTVSPSLGDTTDTPIPASRALAIARIPDRIQNSQNGWGSALPTRSIPPIARMTSGNRGSATSTSVAGAPASSGTRVVMASPRSITVDDGRGSASGVSPRAAGSG
jgi:hypothetical protein